MGGTWSSGSTGQGSVLEDPSLAAANLKAQFEPTSTLRANAHYVFTMYTFQLREIAILVALGSNSTALQQAVLSCNKALDDLGSIFAPYYGVAFGKQISSYLKEGTNCAVEYLQLARRLHIEKRANMNKDSLKADLKRWEACCIQLSTFFVSQNPSLPQEGVQGQFTRMITLYDQQVTALMEDFNDSSLMRFKDMLNHVRGLADLITMAILTHVNKGKQ